MKLLINSSDYILDSNLEFNIKTNIDTTNFNSCTSQYIDIPITWNNINEFNNVILIIEKNIVTNIYLPEAQYLNYNQISSQLMITINIYSTNKNYIVNYNQQTRKYTIKNNNLFSFKFNTLLAKVLGVHAEYINTSIVESFKICNLFYNNIFINFDLLQPEILTNNVWYNYLIPIENIDDNIVNKFTLKNQSNQINKMYSYINNIKINFIDCYNNKIFPDTFFILLKLI